MHPHEQKLFDRWIESSQSIYSDVLFQFFFRLSIGDRKKRLLSVAFLREIIKRTDTQTTAVDNICCLLEKFSDGHWIWEEFTKYCLSISEKDYYFQSIMTKNPTHSVYQISVAINTRFAHRKSEDIKTWQGKIIVDFWGGFDFDPQWKTSDAVAIANNIYDNKNFTQMPILADAMQDAGCDDEIILIRMRDPQHPWHRGCYLIDHLIGKR